MGAGGDTRIYICDQARYILLGCSVDGPAGVGGPHVYVYLGVLGMIYIYVPARLSLSANIFLQPIPVDGRFVVAGRHEYIYISGCAGVYRYMHRLRPWVATGTPVGGRVRQLVGGFASWWTGARQLAHGRFASWRQAVGGQSQGQGTPGIPKTGGPLGGPLGGRLVRESSPLAVLRVHRRGDWISSTVQGKTTKSLLTRTSDR